VADWGDFHNVTGAGWSVYWRISKHDESGLELWWADFQGKRVMWRGTMPLAIVPYHRPPGGSEPPGPQFCYKDGLDTYGGGAHFRALVHGAANSGKWWTNNAADAAKDTDAVVAVVEPATDFEPAHLVISAKFQCGWYQYVHSWQFGADGAIHPRAAMGGMLNPFAREVPHTHNFYFRIDLDIDGQYPHDVCEVFNHNSLNYPGGDQWDPVVKQSKLLADPQKARKWRVRNTISKNVNGEFRAYNIEIPQQAERDQYSTGDVFVTVYRGDNVQQGEGIGAIDSSDQELENQYAVGPLDIVKGNDIVLWVVVRSHHEPRPNAEEIDHLPYHYEGFSIVPHSFEVFRERDPAGNG
jgi:Cu2+-containing amine oxidase